MTRLLLIKAIVFGVVPALACGVGAIGDGTIGVIYKNEPAGITPFVLATYTIVDTDQAPQSGTVVLKLEWRGNKWNIAARDTIGNPWLPNEVRILHAEYPCFPGRWREVVTYDGINANGDPVSGTVYGQGGRFGVKLRC